MSALSDVRVLDLSRLLPGGFCSLLLADFGAEVLKVEDTGMGDYVRWSAPGYEGADDSAGSALFLAVNRGKRSIRLNLKDEGGRAVLLRLVREHDVLLESFRPGVMDRLGVGYERLREENAVYDARVRKSAEILEQLKRYFPDALWPCVRYNSKLSEAPGFGQHIFEYSKRSNGAADYARLAERVAKGT